MTDDEDAGRATGSGTDSGSGFVSWLRRLGKVDSGAAISALLLLDDCSPSFRYLRIGGQPELNLNSGSLDTIS